MENGAIEKLLTAYESGRSTRRQFVQALTGLLLMPKVAESQAKATPFAGRSLNHVTITVTDLQRSRKFYQQLLGLPVLGEDSDSCNLALGESFLSINQDLKPGIGHFCVGVEGFDLATAKKKLIKERLEPRIEYDTQLYFDDPDGIKVQLAAPGYRG